MLPLIVFAVGIVFHDYEQDRKAATQRVIETVRSIRLVLDAEMQRVTGGYLSSQASYSTWRDFGAAVGPLSAPFLFLYIPQTWLFGTLGLLMAAGVVFCLARR